LKHKDGGGFSSLCPNYPRGSQRGACPPLGGRGRQPTGAGEWPPYANKGHIATDHDGDLVYLTRLKWDIDRIERDHPQVRLMATKDMLV